MNQAVMTAITTEIGKAIKAMPALPCGTVRIDETITLRVCGTLEKGADEEYTPTISVPVKALAAALLERMGATREAGIAMLVAAITDALNSDRKAAGTITERMRDAEAAFKMVNDRLLATLPKSTRTGKTRWDGRVTPVEGVTATEAAAAVNPAPEGVRTDG